MVTKKYSTDHVLEMFIWSSVAHPIEFFNFSVELFQLDNSSGMVDKILFVKYRHYLVMDCTFRGHKCGSLVTGEICFKLIPYDNEDPLQLQLWRQKLIKYHARQINKIANESEKSATCII